MSVESKVIRHCFGFTKLCLMIGPENSRNPLDQSNVKLKSTAPWSFVFSRASSSFLVFTLSFHWLASDKVKLFSDWTLGIGFRHSIGNFSYHPMVRQAVVILSLPTGTCLPRCISFSSCEKSSNLRSSVRNQPRRLSAGVVLLKALPLTFTKFRIY